MRAAAYDTFGGPIAVREFPDPVPGPGEAILRVGASGICRSDWHGWQGRDPDIHEMPHVPGHEFAGEVEAVGSGVTSFQPGDRVAVPFVAGCGDCEPCRLGNQQVCDAQSQPGFTHWGSFAQFVRVRYAEDNMVLLPDEIEYVTAAALGCRFTTAYRAVSARARTTAGEWVAVHGCGGVGLSAIMIARSLDARVAAVDINPAALELAVDLGAEVAIDGRAGDVAATILDATGGGAHVSIDAMGHPAILRASVSSLRKLGRHVQVGLLVGEDSPTPVPMDLVVGRELEVMGSHGMQAHLFPGLFDLILSGALDPDRLVTRLCKLDQGAELLESLDDDDHAGITVIDRFG
jgi:alcohol dehydrogenase